MALPQESEQSRPLMTSAICTLFEGDYHFGVGALANSLYSCGFRGTIYAGYRGQLPPWATGTKEFNGCTEYSPVEGLTLRFIPLTTKIHLTNYKPDFMLDVWERHCPQATSLFYYDPDIIVRFPWSFFEEWVSDAVALCEDVNSPMPDSHPKRNAWRRLLTVRGHQWKNRQDIYVNGGFVALSQPHKEFLLLWSRIITQIGEVGVDLNAISTAKDYRFWNNDQDALNITGMATTCPTSCAGKDGMGFKAGNSFMLHALGQPKPWNTGIIRQFLMGRRPNPIQRAYWENATSPIKIFHPRKIAIKRLAMNLAALGNRFYGS